MFDAAEVVADEDQKKGLLSTEELASMRTRLNVTHLFTTDAQGNFIRSTNEDPKLIPNLFSFCGDYKNLITGNEGKRVTPIIPPRPEPSSFKFLTIPNYNRTRLIHVGVRVDFLQKALSTAMVDDQNILALNIYAPDGSSLGSFNKDGANLLRTKISIPQSVNSISESPSGFKILTKVESPQTQCCQCDVAGISKAGAYYYVIESLVSDKELVAAQASIKHLFWILQMIALIFAIFAAKWLSRKLVERIELVATRVREMGISEDIGARINVSGTDEIGYLAKEFNELLDKLEKSQKTLIASQNKAAIGEMAREVAHNINSPLLSLQNALRSLNGSNEVMRMLRNAVNEIKNHLGALKLKSDDDAKQILRNTNRPLPTRNLNPHAYLVFLVLEDVISEKIIQNERRTGIKIKFSVDCDAKEQFSKFDLTEFRSVFSNLINNAVEAIEDSGEINIHLSADSEILRLRVVDNGTGIPQTILSQVFERNFTYGKENGSGLGLHHAKVQIENFGGKIQIESLVDSGTAVTISIPTVPAPEWFISSVDFSDKDSVIIIDDAISIHDLWKSKISGKNIFAFSCSEEFEKWFSSDESKDIGEVVYLVDYNLNESISGIDLIEKHSIASKSVLFTAEFDDQSMLTRANWVGVKVMPKVVC